MHRIFKAVLADRGAASQRRGTKQNLADSIDEVSLGKRSFHNP
jgi:hypothetical protein